MASKDNGVAVNYDQLVKVIEKISDRQGTLERNTQLDEIFELDSLEKVKLASALESAFGVDLCESQIVGVMTIDDLADRLNNQVTDQNYLKINKLNFSPPVVVLRQVLQIVLLPLLRIFYPIRVEGSHHLENISSPYIFAINHTSHLDTPTFIKAMPYRIRVKLAFAAAADVFYSENKKDTLSAKLKRFFYEVSLNIFPFSRKVSLRKSIDNCIEVINLGYHVCIYPESKRTISGEIMEFKSGVGILAHATRVPVVPVKIEGLFTILKKGQRLPRFGRVVVKIGEPYEVNSQSYTEIVKDIKERVVAL